MRYLCAWLIKRKERKASYLAAYQQKSKLGRTKSKEKKNRNDVFSSVSIPSFMNLVHLAIVNRIDVIILDRTIHICKLTKNEEMHISSEM